MRIIRRLFVLFCLVATGALVWAGVYTRREGFTESWRDAIEREFASRGYHVSIGKITLGAFRGLVAEDVRFYQDGLRSEELAFVDDVHLDLDLSQILEKKLSINSLDVQDASLSLPLVPGEEGRKGLLQVEHFSGRVVVTESFIEILRAEAEIAGIDVSVTGTLVRPPDPAEDGGSEKGEEAVEEMGKRRELASEVLGFLHSLEFGGEEKPRVEVRFRGDWRDLSSSTATAKFSATGLRRRGRTHEVKDFRGELAFEGSEGRLEFRDLALADEKGSLRTSGAWHRDRGEISFHLESTADLAGLVGLFVRDRRLGEIVFFQPPRVEAEGHLSLEKLAAWPEEKSFPGEVIGEFGAERFVSRGTVFNGLSFGFSLAGEKIYLRNLRLDHKSGVAFLNFKHEPGAGDESVLYQSEIKLDPRVFRPFFHEEGRRFIDSWDFGEQSTVYIAAMGHGPELSPRTWQNEGVVDLRNFRLNGVEFRQLETEVETDQQFFWFRNVVMSRDDGKITAELAQSDLDTKMWEVKGAVSTTDLIEGARAFNAKLAESLEPYRLTEPPTIRLHGTIDGRRNEDVGDSIRRNKLSLSFASPGTADFRFLGETLPLVGPEGSVEIEGSRVHVTSFGAGLFGGRVGVVFDSKDVRSPAKPYEAAIEIESVPVDSLTSLYGGYDASTGKLTATVDLAGHSGSVSNLEGRGNAAIRDGDLFAIPLLGPLSRKVRDSPEAPAGESSPGNVAREASASFSIDGGVFTTADLVALTNTYAVHGAGSLDARDGSVDFEAVVNFRGGLGKVIMAPVSELLTYSCGGTIGDPQWKPKHISNLGKFPAEVANGVAEIPVQGLRLIGRGLLGERKGEDPDRGDGSARGEESHDEEGSDQEGGAEGKPRNAIQGIGRQLFKKKNGGGAAEEGNDRRHRVDGE